MPIRTILVAIPLLGWLAILSNAQERNPQPSAKPETRFTPAELAERTLHRRAVEAVIWGMPAVNAELMFRAMKDAEADFNQVVYWSRPLSWKNQTLTPNPDTIYVFPFFNTKDAGPMVLEIPPTEDDASITGSIDDSWQTALEDVGPAGVDKGKGGKYLILPPGYKDKVPDGYVALPSETYTGFVILRSNLKSGSDADIAKARRPIAAFGNSDGDQQLLEWTTAGSGARKWAYRPESHTGKLDQGLDETERRGLDNRQHGRTTERRWFPTKTIKAKTIPTSL